MWYTQAIPCMYKTDYIISAMTVHILFAPNISE